MIRRTSQDDALASSCAKINENEIVIDAKTGRARQAGSDQSEGKFILDLKDKCEQDLYVFAKVVMKRDYLVPHLHGKLCRWIQKYPPYRKMLLIPRIHAKTSMGSHCLPCHALIQSAERNPYMPGVEGSQMRIMLAGETEARAMGNLRVIESAFETNKLLRAFWPHRCWDNPRAQSKKWNEREMIIPRETEFGDPSIRALGVGVAIAGARVDFAIKDDLVGEEAMNSPTTMDTTIRWHVNSRALYEHQDTTPELILGTRWSPKDLYEDIETNDVSVEPMVRSIIEDGHPIWPERFTLTDEPGKTSIQNLQKEFGVMYFLFYMNSAADPALTDFDSEKLRFYTLVNEQLIFEEDGRDVALTQVEHGEEPVTRGEPLTQEKMKALFGDEDNSQAAYFHAKYG